jgi:hypothetical protein
MKFPEGISQRTRCLEVAVLSQTSQGKMPNETYGALFITQENLLITQKGQWLLWRFKYKRILREGLGFPYAPNSIRQIAEICKFSLIKEKKLLSFFEKYPYLGKNILFSFQSSLCDCVIERRLKFQEIKKAEKSLTEIIDRIHLKV